MNKLENIEAEQAIVASVLLRCDDAAKIFDRVCRCGALEDDFTDAAAKKCIAAIGDALAKGEPADALTVAAKSGVSVATITAWMDATPTAAHAEYYAGMVHDLATRRRLVKACQSGIVAAMDAGASAAFAAGRVELLIADAVDRAAIHEGGSVGRLLEERTAYYRDCVQRGYGGLQTGLDWLDDVFGGLAGGRYYIVSGPPACGKTTLVRNVAVDVAKRGHRVAFATLELTPEELAAWMTCTEAGISMRLLDAGNNADAVSRFEIASKEFARLPITIEGARMTPETFASWARREVRRGAELICLDYLQLMQSNDGGDDTEERRVSRASAAVLQVAVGCKVPVLAIASESNVGTLRHSGQLSYDCAGHLRLVKRDDGTGPDIEFRKIRHGAPVDGRKSLWFSRGRLVEQNPSAFNVGD